jgi:hypothetical protein
VHALSPGLYADFTRRLAEGRVRDGVRYEIGGELARELLEFDGCPRYAVRGEPVYCTSDEQYALHYPDGWDDVERPRSRGGRSRVASPES